MNKKTKTRADRLKSITKKGDIFALLSYKTKNGIKSEYIITPDPVIRLALADMLAKEAVQIVKDLKKENFIPNDRDSNTMYR